MSSRRELLAVAVAALSASSCWFCGNPGGEPPPYTPGDRITIDAHAHIVNGHDVPLYGFVKYVYAPGHIPQGALIDAAIHLLEDVIRDSAPGYEAEAENLCALVGKGGHPLPPACAPPAVTARMAAVSRPRPRTLPENPTGVSLDRPRAYLLARLQDPALRTAVVGTLQRARIALPPPEARGRTLRPLSAPALNATPEAATESFLQMFGDLIRDFSSWRLNNLYALERLYPDVDIFVATMLDFDKWVYEGSPVSLSQQADLMTLLAIASDGRVLPFIPFDPWRDVAHRGGVLAWVRAAIESGAAVGVKLYPPMGFRASHNDQSFEDWRAGLDQDHLGADFGQRVDASLDALFAWSAANGVPILAHTGASNYSRLSAKNDAEPTYWEEVLGKYPTLRLNLSHLGGQEAETAPWRDEVVRLFQRPNVYADVACFDPRPDASGGFWPKLKAQVDANPLIGRRLLYGSDWFLLSDCAVPASYENTMRTTVGDMLGSAVSVGVFGDNAIDYLGLRRGQPARTRLDGFYGLYQVDARWRAVVDRH